MIVFNAVSHLVAPNSVNFSVTLNFLVYALGKWSFHSIICFNSKFFIIILKTLLTKTFFGLYRNCLATTWGRVFSKVSTPQLSVYKVRTLRYYAVKNNYYNPSQHSNLSLLGYYLIKVLYHQLGILSFSDLTNSWGEWTPGKSQTTPNLSENFLVCYFFTKLMHSVKNWCPCIQLALYHTLSKQW